MIGVRLPSPVSGSEPWTDRTALPSFTIHCLTPGAPSTCPRRN